MEDEEESEIRVKGFEKWKQRRKLGKFIDDRDRDREEAQMFIFASSS